MRKTFFEFLAGYCFVFAGVCFGAGVCIGLGSLAARLGYFLKDRGRPRVKPDPNSSISLDPNRSGAIPLNQGGTPLSVDECERIRNPDQEKPL